MAKRKTTLSIDERLLRRIRVRAARLGRPDSEVFELALREGLGLLDRIRERAGLEEEEAIGLASKLVHETRGSRRRRPRAR
jgi:hypothetical protein